MDTNLLEEFAVGGYRNPASSQIMKLVKGSKLKSPSPKLGCSLHALMM
jgi:hypothetical protein